MTKKGANTGFILLGTGVALAIAMSITGVVVFNKRKRQSEYDFLIKVINANLDENTLSKLKGSSFDKNYYTIQGTKYALILPDTSFKNSSTFTGVKNEITNAVITIMDLPYSYDTTLNFFADKNSFFFS
jgi:hypothetical protein